MSKDNKNLHENHRERLKEKFLKLLEEGMAEDGLEDHEFIELLLFYAIPRKNTNEIAHRLINEFGSLGNILEADTENLIEIEGISHHTATMLKLMASCAKRYINDVNDIKNARLTPLNINTYIKNLFYGHTKEIAYAVLMDSDCIVRKIKRLSTGTVNAAPLYPREVVKLAVNERYPYMILAHNHPNGNAMPSGSDLKITKTIELALNFVEVRLVDHVIVSGEQVISLARNFKFFDR
ncbi:MAG: RadC family protein [Clostridia bacterium]|nr:RadC family protein [Clostridia bacterium]